jgi:hypothetical protein
MQTALCFPTSFPPSSTLVSIQIQSAPFPRARNATYAFVSRCFQWMFWKIILSDVTMHITRGPFQHRMVTNDPPLIMFNGLLIRPHFALVCSNPTDPNITGMENLLNRINLIHPAARFQI